LGRKSEVKTFYEGPPNYDNPKATNWVEYVPPSLPELKKARFEGAAIQVFKKLDETQTFGDVATYYTSFIKLQSPSLRTELQPVLEPFGVYFHEDYAYIYRPFTALYHGRDKIYSLSRIAESGEAREHLDLLCSFINDEIASTIEEAETLHNAGQITYTLLWTLFPAGELMIVKSKNCETGCRVVSYEYDQVAMGAREDCFRVRYKNVMFDGSRYGYLEHYTEQRSFTGKKPINELAGYPLDQAKDPAVLRKKLIQRGKRALDFQDVHCMWLRESESMKVPQAPSEKAQNLSWKIDVSQP
jgi:hypothetical protein